MERQEQHLKGAELSVTHLGGDGYGYPISFTITGTIKKDTPHDELRREVIQLVFAWLTRGLEMEFDTPLAKGNLVPHFDKESFEKRVTENLAADPEGCQKRREQRNAELRTAMRMPKKAVPSVEPPRVAEVPKGEIGVRFHGGVRKLIEPSPEPVSDAKPGAPRWELWVSYKNDEDVEHEIAAIDFICRHRPGGGSYAHYGYVEADQVYLFDFRQEAYACRDELREKGYRARVRLDRNRELGDEIPADSLLRIIVKGYEEDDEDAIDAVMDYADAEIALRDPRTADDLHLVFLFNGKQKADDAKNKLVVRGYEATVEPFTEAIAQEIGVKKGKSN